MKKILFFLTILFVFCGLSYSQVKIATAYNYPVQDSVLNGLKSIRGMDYAADPFGDGHSIFVLSNYNLQGSVSVFRTVANDSIELVWQSPPITENGGGSTPRSPLLGDLDNDGLIEVIFQSAGNGIYIYEWDGVPGSYNFGTQPSQLITAPSTLSNASGSVENMQIADVDGDGVNELLVPYNSDAANDKYYIINAKDNNWDTDNPGFSAFNVESQPAAQDLADYGLSNGSPISMIPVDFDGSGKKEILLQAWDNMKVTVQRVTGTDTYELPDKSTGKTFLELGGPGEDNVAIFSGLAYDVDGDGRQEVYLPYFPWPDADVNDANGGLLSVIAYDEGSNLNQIDESNNYFLSFRSITGKHVSLFGYGYGDLDGNGKENIYISSSYPYNILSLEYQGGDKRDTANYIASLVYKGEDDIYTAVDIRDSAGVVDTVFHVQPAFASKIYARNTDFDKDGKQDILMPYQALNDSTAIVNLTYNSGTSKFDTTSSVNILNPKRWGFRILESEGATGIKEINLSVVTPDQYKLEQNYPNPFNPTTNIRFTLPLQKKISLKVYDILGNEVKTLLNNQDFSKGSYEVTWDGTNNFGNKVASGQYIYTLKYGNFTKSMKMTLLK